MSSSLARGGLEGGMAEERKSAGWPDARPGRTKEAVAIENVLGMECDRKLYKLHRLAVVRVLVPLIRQRSRPARVCALPYAFWA